MAALARAEQVDHDGSEMKPALVVGQKLEAFLAIFRGLWRFLQFKALNRKGREEQPQSSQREPYLDWQRVIIAIRY